MSEASVPKSQSSPSPLEPAPAKPRTGPKGGVTALVCGLLLVAFGVTAWSAIRTKCATFDEPMHSLGAYMVAHYGDYRVNPEDPPLWHWWISLATRPGELKVDVKDPAFGSIPGSESNRWNWTGRVLYRTPGNHADAFIMKARTMLLLLGIALSGVIAWWSWRLAGGVAAITAAALFAADPNFLAHAAVVKNDVAISLVGTALALATWYAGRRLTRVNAPALVLLGAAALVTKFSGPLVLLALAATLAVRVLLPVPWPCGKRTVTSLPGRAGVAAVLLLLTAVVGYFAIWACYDFRFYMSKDGRVWEMEPLLRSTAINEARLLRPEIAEVTPEEFDEHMNHPAALVQAVTYCQQHHLLPDSFCYGLIYVYRSSRIRDSYLLGQHSIIGFRSYFPLAFLFKTPVATLLSFAIAAGLGVGALVDWRRRRRRSDGTDEGRTSTTLASIAPMVWSVACLAVPFAVLGYADVRAKLNIGLRHILPLYPFLFIATGCAASRAWRRWGGNSRVVFAGLALALLIETAAAFPNYISFFNRVSSGIWGNFYLLSDSNLDWGQDLPLLAKWQRDHPERHKLYLHYFGTADPPYYGIRSEPPPWLALPRNAPPEVVKHHHDAGVVAISTTYLQGVYLPPELRQAYEDLYKENPPLDVLGGGTIYLYDYDPNAKPPAK